MFCLSMTAARYRLVAATLSLAFLLSGCIFAYIPQPLPIFPYGPDAKPIPDRKELSVVDETLTGGSNSTGSRSVFIAMRGTRVVGKESKLDEQDVLKEIPAPDFKPSVISSVAPPLFRTPKEGDRHYFNFTLSKDFAEGITAFFAGESEKSVKAFERVLADPEVKRPAAWQASMHLVYLHLMMGRPDLAETEVQRTELWEKKMTEGNNAYSRAVRAEVRYWAGDFEGAIADAKDVLASIGDWTIPTIYPSPPRDQVDVVRFGAAKVRAMTVLGMLYTAKGMYKEAMPWLEQSAKEMNNVVFLHWVPLYAVYITANNWEVFYGQGWSLTSLATALLAQDPDSARAAEMFADAQKFFDAIGYVAGKVLIESFKAQVLLATGHYQRAERQATVALSHARKSRLLDFIWRLEAVRGEALLKLDRWAEAEQSLRAAQTIVDQLSGTMVSDMAKVRFGVGKEIITRNLVKIDVRKRDWPTLFQDLERGRARAFVSMLANRSVGAGSNVELTERIHALDKEILGERQRKYGFMQNATVESGREEDLLARRQKIVEELHAKNPDLAEAYAVSTVGLARVQRSLDAGDLMLYALPTQGDEPLSLLQVTARDVQLRILPVTTRQFGQHLKDFVATLWTAQPKAQHASLAQLGQDLALASWGKPANVLVVPSGDLHFVPWGALDVSFAVGVLPTGGWIVRSPHKSLGRIQACVVGDPEFGGVLPQLPDARDEAVALAKLYGTQAIIGSDATEQALRRRVGAGVDVLHLATHALYDPLYPLQSSLILSDGTKAVPLSAEKLYRAPLSSRLVVLSACETGMGQVISGDDLLGLTRSFYLGGTNVILSSLWPVSDEATRIFMEQFHKSARGGDYGKAWLAARDAVRSRGATPAEYGAFVLGGMPRER
ncbi:MAG: CHAT domain-containing protein [Humidesulfovibrio sp.]|uniref:CHAT domain-containing protein n=1 Tax=Humidesulfovibrio sp. TaxID=2910988 RepID=UPI0027F65F32|nr:CHAT domain-containing protein [Humidesulfovibrio sp.]MDQ7836381.1 CHAT domain-containing protein [Humidesulfovibrio sp.]